MFRARGGFTLLEVMLAVAIIGFTTVGIFRFVQSTVRAVAVSVEDTEEQLRVDRLVALVQEEFYSLPARGQTNIQGESIKLNGADFDSIEWRSRGGPAWGRGASTGTSPSGSTSPWRCSPTTSPRWRRWPRGRAPPWTTCSRWSPTS